MGSSRRWIGDSSEVSLLKLWLLELWRRFGGYGEPHWLAVYSAAPSSPDSARLSGGVLKMPITRSGSRGARSGGRSGDASPSAVEALESAGEDVAGDLYGYQESLRLSCADARGGV